MSNTVVHNDPDTSAQPGKNVAPVHLISPGSGLAVEPAARAVAGYVALTSPPAQTSAGVDTALTFGSQVNHWLLQNNTAANVMFELDAVASLGSIVLSPGAIVMADLSVTVLHVFTAAAQNVNGTSAGNLVLKGWA